MVIAVLSLHLLALPLCFSVLLDLDSDKKTGRLKVMFYFLPVFVKKLDLDKISEKLDTKSAEKKDEADKEKDKDKKPSGSKRRVTAFLLKIGIELVKRIRVRDIELDSVIGTGDAAATAYAVGSLKIALSQICAYFGVPDKGSIMPDYDATKLFIFFSGIFSLCLGDIIYAVCSVILSNITVRGRIRRDYGNGTYTG